MLRNDGCLIRGASWVTYAGSPLFLTVSVKCYDLPRAICFDGWLGSCRLIFHGLLYYFAIFNHLLLHKINRTLGEYA